MDGGGGQIVKGGGGDGGTSVPSNGPDVNNLNKPWKHTGMDMCFCWRKHYSGVIENKNLNPRGDRNGERETWEERQRYGAGVKTLQVCSSIWTDGERTGEGRVLFSD